jgi:hypothetical protein
VSAARERALVRLWVVVLVLALAGVVKAIDARKPTRGESLLYLPDKRLLQVLACGHGTTLADVAWLRATGYVLDEFKQGKVHIEYLYELFDAMTELDANFVEAYEAGAIFLSSLAQRPDAAERLLDKGEGRVIDDGKTVRRDPAAPGRVHPRHAKRWRLAYLRASLHLVSLAGSADTGEEREAEIRKAGRLWLYTAETYPDAPRELKVVGERLREKRYDDRSRAEWEVQIWNERLYTGNEALRAVARKRLDEAQAELDRALLELAVRRYIARNGRPPARLDDVIGPAYGMPAMPEDPLGVGFRLEGDRVRARGAEAARIARTLERRIESFREQKGRAPATLAELDPPPALPPDVAVDYDPATGAVNARPR